MSATVIDALIVTLGLDAKSFTQGQKDALAAFKKTEGEATRTAKEMEARGKQGAEFFSAIRSQALKLAVLLTGGMGIKAFVEKITMSDLAVGRLSNNLGLGVKSLSAWQGLAERYGAKAGDMDSALRQIQRMILTFGNWGELSKNDARAFQELHISLSKYFDKSLSYEDRLKMLQEGLHSVSREQAQYWGQQLGMSEQVINMLVDTHGHTDSLLKKQLELNVANKKDVELAELRLKAYRDLAGAMERKGKDILNAITPKATSLAEKLGRTIQHPWDELEMDTADLIEAFLKKETVHTRAIDHYLKAIGNKSAPSTAQAPAAVNNLLPIVRKLESSGDTAVSSAGAVGRYQIKPDTARMYDPSLKDASHGDITERLKNVAYNTEIASRILADLSRKYGGNVAQIMAAYNQGERGSATYRATGDLSALKPEGQRYLAHLSRLMATDQAPATSTSTSAVNIQNLVINTQATDAQGIAREIGPALKRYGAVVPADSGLR